MEVNVLVGAGVATFGALRNETQDDGRSFTFDEPGLRGFTYRRYEAISDGTV